MDKVALRCIVFESFAVPAFGLVQQSVVYCRLVSMPSQYVMVQCVR